MAADQKGRLLQDTSQENDTRAWDKKRANLPEGTPVKVEFNLRQPAADPAPPHQRTASDQELEIHSRNSTISGPDEETTLYSTTRMLQDNTGRLRK